MTKYPGLGADLRTATYECQNKSGSCPLAGGRFPWPPGRKVSAGPPTYCGEFCRHEGRRARSRIYFANTHGRRTDD